MCLLSVKPLLTLALALRQAARCRRVFRLFVSFPSDRSSFGTLFSRWVSDIILTNVGAAGFFLFIWRLLYLLPLLWDAALIKAN